MKVTITITTEMEGPHGKALTVTTGEQGHGPDNPRFAPEHLAAFASNACDLHVGRLIAALDAGGGRP